MLLENLRMVDGRLVDINIGNGKIAEINEKEGDGDFYVLPGIIDVHVHFREPIFYKGDGNWFNESRAAAAGGVTTVLEMPNTSPSVVNEGVLRQKRQFIDGRSLVNYGFYGAAGIEDNCDFLASEKNIVGVKVYMGETTGGILVSDDELLRKYFSLDRLVAVHTDDVERTLRLASKGLYFCHVSTKKDFELLKNTDHYIEVTPHHLFLDESCKHPYAKMNPSLATKEDVEYLWSNLDRIDVIASDHAPHARENKEKGAKGITGVQTMLPLMLNAVNEGRLGLERLVELMSNNPARIFKLKDKGKIEVGYDADLTIVDIDAIRNTRDKDIESLCGWTVYRERLKGWPVMTVVGGNIVYNEKSIDLFSNEMLGKEVKYER